MTGAPGAPSPRPTFPEAILLLLLMLAVSGVGMGAILIGHREATIDIVLLGVAEVFAILLTLLLGLRLAKAPVADTLALRPAPVWTLAAAVPLAAGAAILISALEIPLQNAIPMPEDFAVHLANLLYPESTTDWARIIAAAVLLIPLGEELLFRGLFLSGFVPRYGRFRALAFSSLLFAIAHLNPWGFAGIFIAGWLLGALVLRTGSLWPAVILHSTYNLASVVQLKLSFPERPTVATMIEVEAEGVEPLLLAFAAVVVGALLVAYARWGRNPRNRTPLPTEGF